MLCERTEDVLHEGQRARGQAFQGGGARQRVPRRRHPGEAVLPGHRRGGGCAFDKTCTNLFFDVVDRRYEKEGPNAMVLASTVAPSGWDEFLAGDDTLLCALDRLFDKASVFMMRGPSYRGRGLGTYSVEAIPQTTKVRGMQPKGV